MKTLLAILVVVSLPSIVFAQDVHRRILIVTDTNVHYSFRLNAEIAAIYSGSIDSLHAIPPDLSRYDAIFIDRRPYLEDSIGALNLIEYIKAGKSFYVQAKRDQLPAVIPFKDTILRTLGVKKFDAGERFMSYGQVHGVDSEYTYGMDSSSVWSTSDYYYFQGNITPILFARSFDPRDYPIAWISEDTSLHAVIYYNQVDGLFHQFLQRTICNYFGLCSADVFPSSAEPATIAIHVDNDRSIYVERSGLIRTEIEIMNVLGTRVLQSIIPAGERQFQLPAELPPGFYFARLQTDSASAVKSFVILSR
jgi:hypothetical protein